MQLVLRFLELAHSRRPPNLLLLHLEENDLPMMSSVELSDLTVEDLLRISQISTGLGGTAPLKSLAWCCQTKGGGLGQEDN